MSGCPDQRSPPVPVNRTRTDHLLPEPSEPVDRELRGTSDRAPSGGTFANRSVLFGAAEIAFPRLGQDILLQPG